MNPNAVDQERGNWRPSSKCHIVPTLIITCGAFSHLEVANLRAQVLERVGLVLPRGFVHWVPRESNDTTLLEKVEQILAPFIKLDYIEALQARGLAQDMLDEDRDYDLHIIVVHKRGEDSNPSQFLRELGTKIRNTISGGVRFSLILITIGEGPLDLGDSVLFWPCFRLSHISYGRFAVSDRRVFEVCQNLLVALTTSELVKGIEWHLLKEKQDIAWIWIGASALVVDIPSMQDYVRLQVLHHLVERMIGIEPSRVELQAREYEVEILVDRLQGENLADALTRLQPDWSFRLQTHTDGKYSTTQLLGEPTIKFKDLYYKITKPDLRLSQILHDYYCQVRDCLINFLGSKIRQRYQVLVSRIFTLFDPPPDYAKQQTEDWQLKYPPLFGLAAVAHAIEIATQRLYKSADLVFPQVSYHRIGSNAYLASVASEDAQLAHRNYIRFRRKERRFLSWLGFLVKLIPAWPLLTGFLIILPQWSALRWLMAVLPPWPEEWCLAIIAFLLLACIATIEYYAWQIDLAKLWETLKRGTISEIATTVLQITYKVLRDYRMLMVGRLQEISLVLKELLNLLQSVEHEYRLLSTTLKEKIVGQEKRRSSIYWLSDLASCDDWAKRALKKIDTAQMVEDKVDGKHRPIFNIQARTLLEQILKHGPRFSYARDPRGVLCHREIYYQIETIVQHAVNIASSEGRWEFYKEQSKEEYLAEIAKAPVRGIAEAIQVDQHYEPRYVRITEDEALHRLVSGETVYRLEKKDRYRPVLGREPIDFLPYPELDIGVLCEKEELLKEGRRWEWLYQRAIPLGSGEKSKSLCFLTTEHDSLWKVGAMGWYSEYWQKLKQRGQEFIILRSNLPNELGALRMIIEYK